MARAVPAVAAPGRAGALPRQRTDAFERLRALPEHRMIDRLLRGRVWIWVIGMMLGGIVAMQVSLLELNAGISQSVERTGTLERQNADLEVGVAQLASGERVASVAAREGMMIPAAGAVGYLTARPQDARLAAERMQPPSDEARQVMVNGGWAPASTVAPATIAPTAAAPTTTAPTATAPTPTVVTPPPVTPAPAVAPAPAPVQAAPPPTTAATGTGAATAPQG